MLSCVWGCIALQFTVSFAKWATIDHGDDDDDYYYYYDRQQLQLVAGGGGEEAELEWPLLATTASRLGCCFLSQL